MSETMTGAQIVLKALQDQGVEHIFGYPGGLFCRFMMRFFSKMRSSIFWYATSRVRPMPRKVMRALPASRALCWLHPGPVPQCGDGTDGCADGFIPMVCITGQVATHLIGNDAFQEADTVGITRPCTKHNYLVKSADDLPRILHEAFHVATTGRRARCGRYSKDVQFAEQNMRPQLFAQDL